MTKAGGEKTRYLGSAEIAAGKKVDRQVGPVGGDAGEGLEVAAPDLAAGDAAQHVEELERAIGEVAVEGDGVDGRLPHEPRGGPGGEQCSQQRWRRGGDGAGTVGELSELGNGSCEQ